MNKNAKPSTLNAEDAIIGSHIYGDLTLTGCSVDKVKMVAGLENDYYNPVIVIFRGYSKDKFGQVHSDSAVLALTEKQADQYKDILNKDITPYFTINHVYEFNTLRNALAFDGTLFFLPKDETFSLTAGEDPSVEK
jgi:hypothetical protein